MALDVLDDVPVLLVDAQWTRRAGEADVAQVLQQGLHLGRPRVARTAHRPTDADDARGLRTAPERYGGGVHLSTVGSAELSITASLGRWGVR